MDKPPTILRIFKLTAFRKSEYYIGASILDVDLIKLYTNDDYFKEKTKFCDNIYDCLWECYLNDKFSCFMNENKYNIFIEVIKIIDISKNNDNLYFRNLRDKIDYIVDKEIRNEIIINPNILNLQMNEGRDYYYRLIYSTDQSNIFSVL